MARRTQLQSQPPFSCLLEPCRETATLDQGKKRTIEPLYAVLMFNKTDSGLSYEVQRYLTSQAFLNFSWI